MAVRAPSLSVAALADVPRAGAAIRPAAMIERVVLDIFVSSCMGSFAKSCSLDASALAPPCRSLIYIVKIISV
ncbi:hypothetical protein D3C72_2375590 [compost metagenome]